MYKKQLFSQSFLVRRVSIGIGWTHINPKIQKAAISIQRRILRLSHHGRRLKNFDVCQEQLRKTTQPQWKEPYNVSVLTLILPIFLFTATGTAQNEEITGQKQQSVLETNGEAKADHENSEHKEEKVEEEETSCAFCKYMRAGPCGKHFRRWEKCLKVCKEQEKDFVVECKEPTALMYECMHEYPEYYKPVFESKGTRKGEGANDDVVEKNESDSENKNKTSENKKDSRGDNEGTNVAQIETEK
mmetsp:Transcript_4734/g.6497  ORF Transcript_4734/g.6497 Transcript_4734/m.6497 type:complete len:244 (-) Transcript_4734:250-981(-)